MHCPYCRNTDTRVLDSRVAEDGGAIRRRRSCPACEKRFTTVEQMQLTVLKRSGATEPFTREKAISGVRKACKGRPVSEDDLACLGQQVEDALRSEGWAEVPAHEVGHGDPRPAARARRGGLPPLRQRLPRLRVGRRTSRPRSRCCAPSARAYGRRQTAAHRADPRLPGASWGSGAPGAPPRAAQQQVRTPIDQHGQTTATEFHDTGVGKREQANDGDRERRHAPAAARAQEQGPEDRAGLLAPRACTPTTSSPGSAATSSRPTGRPARPSSSRRASSSPTSGSVNASHDRHHEVLPRRRRHRRPRVEPQAARSTGS